MTVKNLNPIIKTVMTYLIAAIKELVFGMWSSNKLHIPNKGENKYTLEPQYLCILTTCDQRALPTIKEGCTEGCEETLYPQGIESTIEDGVVSE